MISERTRCIKSAGYSPAEHGVQIAVGIRYGINPPSPDPDCPAAMWAEALDTWSTLWLDNQSPFRLLSPACFEWDSLQPIPDIEGADIPRTETLLRMMARSREEGAVRTPAAHFLEDMMLLKWAVGTGLPVYAFHASTLLAFRGEVDMSLTHRRPVRGMLIENPAWNTICTPRLSCILARNSDGVPPAHDRATIFMGMTPTSFLGCRRAYPHEAKPNLYWLSQRVYPREARANLYWQSPWFASEAGRAHALRTLHELPVALMARWHAGWPGVFVKSTLAKHGVWHVDFPPRGQSDVTPGHLMGILLDTPAGYDVLTSPPDERFMLQSLVDFRDEYRVVVVDGHIRCGTPVRRADTPLAPRLSGVREGRMRPFMCSDRGADGPRHDRARTAAYARAARRIIGRMGSDGQGEFVLDMGTDALTGAIIPVEVNSLSRAGMYGMQAQPAWNALLAMAMKTEGTPCSSP